MIVRLTHIGASFLAVFGVYWLYALSIVPLIEPSAEALPTRDFTQQDRDKILDRPNRNRRLLEENFAPGDWELQKDVKILENEKGKVLVKEYETLPDKRLKLTPCTMVFFPKGEDSDSPPVIMQAPEGAILEFDPPFDPKAGKMGKLVAGQLLGEITIRSRPSRPGAGDDLEIKTRDVQLKEARVRTTEHVDFRLGLSHGSGREMIMGLAPPADGDEVKSSGVRVGALQWLELEREVKMHMQPSGNSLLPGNDTANRPPKAPASPAPGAARLTGVKPPEPPVDIQCEGPFRFDLVQNIASFSRQVDVLRRNPEGPGDQMNCELLSIYFVPRDKGTGSASNKPAGAAAAKTEGSGAAMPNLEPRVVEATGDPVIVNSPSNGGRARCQRLQYDVKTRRILLEGSRDVELHYQGSNEIRTRRFEYEPGPTGGLGHLEAAGPGTLQGAMVSNPAQKYQARWSQEMSIRPDGPLHVVSLLGMAQVRSTDRGTLDADEIHAWVLEAPNPPGETAPRARQPVQTASFAKSDPAGVQVQRLTPQRVLAQGNVRIDAPQLIGNTGRMEVWFEDPPAAASAGALPGAPRQGFSPLGGGQRSPADRPQQFKVTGQLLRVQAVRGQTVEASDVQVEGRAHISESRTPHPGDKPLVVDGDKIHVAQANTPDAKVTVVGKAAYVESRGLSLSGGKIELDRSANRAWVDGPGRMTLPVKQAPGSHALLETQSLEITWQGGMTFDGLTAIYDRSVVVRGEHQTLATPHMEVRLKRRIDFNDPKLAATESGQSMIDEIRCSGGFVMDNRSFDEHGQTSVEHMEARDLIVNETTGAIQGHGPGVLTSVRLGSSAAAMGIGPAKPAARPPVQSGPAAPKFSYMRVQFEGDIGGNLQRNEVTFSDQVKTVYGPVLDWNQTLDGDDPDKLGPQSAVLSCDQLTVRTAPGVQKPTSDTVELEASGHTLVEGSTFTARAERITYAKMKDLLVLEGEDAPYAQLFRQSQQSGPPDNVAARKIMFWPSTNRAAFENAMLLNMQFGDAPAPAANKGKGGTTKPTRRSLMEDAIKNGKTLPPKNIAN